MEVQGSQTPPARSADARSLRSGFWENRLGPFLEKYCLVLCLSLVVIAGARIVSTYNALSLTADEPTHFACGLEYVAKHVYRLEAEHPPLPRAMEALGPYLIGARPVDIRSANDDGLVALARTGQVNRAIFLMRLGNLPFFLLACLVVGLWGNKFGRPTAVLAVALFTLLPTMLADAGVAATDMSLGANVGAAFLAVMFWAEKPTLRRSLLLGLCTTLAVLSNFSALGYIPTAVVLALICYVFIRWPAWSGGFLPKAGLLSLVWDLVVHWPGWHDLWELGKRRVLPFAISLSFMGLLTWAFYWFSFGPVIVHGHAVKVPAPEFFYGLRDAIRHSAGGHGAFLLGKFSWMGWWYYFPVVLLVKTPIVFLLLFALGTFVCLRERARPIYLMPLAFSLGILLPAMHSHVNIGVRLIEPIYIGLTIVAALGLRQLLQWSRASIASAVTAGALVVWLIISVGVHHPDYFSYLNAFAGKNPENILVDSNYDWGQNLKFLGKRMHALGVQQFSMSAMDAMGIKYPEYHATWDGLPPFKPVNPCVPAPGWNVLSATIEKSLSLWEGTPFYAGPDAKAWYDQVAPTERLGSLMLYYVPADSKLSCIRQATASATSTTALPEYGQRPTRPGSSNAEIRTTKLSDNFYTLEGSDGIVGLLTGSDGLFVVDDGFAPISPKVEAAIKQISDAPIQVLVNTRANVEGQSKVHINGEDVELIPIPGGQIVYFRNADIIMTGDFYGSIQYPNIDPANGGSIDEVLDGFDVVLRLTGPNTKIVPGRGPLSGRTELLAHQQMIQATRFRVAQLLAQGKTRDQVLAMHPTSEYDALVPNSKESTEQFVTQLYADASAHKSAW